MKKIRNEALESMLDKTEELDWSYTIYREPEEARNGWRCEERNYVELEKYSPAGEDFGMIIDFNKEDPVGSCLEDLEEYANNFNVGEHAEMWIPGRGKGGRPSSISELIQDAEDIKKMVFELLDALTQYAGQEQKEPEHEDGDLYRYLKTYLVQNNWDDDYTKEQARSIFTTICLCRMIDAGTARCGQMLHELYDTAYIYELDISYGEFETFMIKYIQLL